MVKGNEKLKGYRFVDLFAGIGGFRLALESMGAQCVFSSEIDRDASLTYFDNFNDMPKGDITKIYEKDIPDHDILCAGFPCQPFSISGKQNGFDDARGTLFFDVARIVKEKRPKIVFMENVKNFASHDSGKTLAVVKKTIEELGYSFNYRVLNASDYGVPQKRERIYMVCFRKDMNINFEFPSKINNNKHVIDIIEEDDSVSNKLYRCKYPYILSKTDDSFSNQPIKLGIVNNGGQGERIYSIKGIAITLSAQGGGVFSKTGGYLINGKARRLTIRECARLMGFPDTFKPCLKEGQAYKQFGNSVVVDVLQYILIEIEKSLNLK